MVFPASADELSTEFLTEVLQPRCPGIDVCDFSVLSNTQNGEGIASTADRVTLHLQYGGNIPQGMPDQLMLKTMLVSPRAPAAMYENEARFYRDIRPELDLETPQIYASDYEKGNVHFGVIMEDLTLRQARFPVATDHVSVEGIRGLLRTLAKLHGVFWQSSRFDGDLNWLSTPVKGGMSDIFQQAGFALVKDQVEKNPFKQELIAPLNITLEQMWERLVAFQHETLKQAQTLLHGDTHIANTYLLPDADGGLFDWQLMVKGNWAHDVSYVLATGLTTEQRREHETELLKYYLSLLAEQDLSDVPQWEQAWDLYRRSIMWGLFIGWLITPPSNYGETITTANITKLVSAVSDLNSFS